MSSDKLRARYEQLKLETARFLERLPEAGSSGLAPLVSKLEELTGLCLETLARAEAEIAELRRRLFGKRADRLTPEQEEQWQKLSSDMIAEAERAGAVTGEILLPEDRAARRRRQHARRRHPLPQELETETVTLEPEGAVCPHCGRTLVRIGEEVTEEIDMVPAKLILRRIVRPKYACRCGEAGVAVAPLPARLLPQSRLGLGLGVYVTLARFDDHLSYYRLEQQFRERHGIVIPRRQMVQWVESIAELVRPIYDAMWRRMVAGDYMQIDETPVRVLDPEVEGKAARGYLWFYAVPGGDVVLDFSRSRGLAPLAQRLAGFSRCFLRACDRKIVLAGCSGGMS